MSYGTSLLDATCGNCGLAIVRAGGTAGRWAVWVHDASTDLDDRCLDPTPDEREQDAEADET